MAADTLTLGQLNRATLARQMLLAREKVSVVEAVERLAGLQAQEAKHPFGGLWTRVEGFEREDLRRALHDRTLVRASLHRSTLHVASATDYAAWRAGLQPVMTAAMVAIRGRDQGLDLKQLIPAARKLLEKEPRTFTELRDLLLKKFPKVNERALGYATRMNLPLVMVPTEDRWAFPSVAEFALADAWLKEPLSEDDDPRPLVLRYLAAFGPASATDMQTWSGLKGIKAVLADLRRQLAVFKDERGRELFDLPDAPRPDAGVAAPPRFLPEFDNLMLAHDDRTRVLPDEHRGSVVTKNLRVRATFLLDGFVRGTWTTERKKDKATVHLSPFKALPKKAAKELTAEGEALLRFLEEDASAFDVKVGSD